MQRLGSAQHGRQRLQGDACDIVLRLLRRKRHSGRLRMKAHQAASLIFRAEALLHQPVPDFSRCSIFGDFFKKIVMRVEKETEARAELVDVEAAPPRPLHVFDAVINSECELLQRGGSGLSYVVPGDGDRVKARSELLIQIQTCLSRGASKAREDRYIPSARCIP